MDDSSNDSVLGNPDVPATPSTPPRRPPPPSRRDPVGISPQTLIGKVLTRIRRSPAHPTLTLDCSDGTTFQVLIDGYNPAYPGVPKSLEMDSSLNLIFNPPTGLLLVNLTIVDCAAITLMDKAHDTRVELQGPRDEQWDQHHVGVAFKFLEDITDGGGKGWHCVWATLAEYDAERGEGDSACVFRSYDDVYLDTLQRSPRSPKKRSPRKQHSRKEFGHPHNRN